MKKILVPVDFSTYTDIKCTYALEYARPTGAEILLYHTYFDQIVIPDSTFPDTMDMNTMYNEELMKEILHQAEKNLDELKNTLENKIKREKLENITVKTAVTGGDIELEIKEVCHEYQPDLLIIGTRGEGKSNTGWGKTSTFVVNHVKVPVLLIPEIKGFMGFQKTMIAVDLSEENQTMIKHVIDLLLPFNVQLNCIHFLLNKKNKKAEAERFEALKKSVIFGGKVRNISFEMIDVEEDNQKAIEEFIRQNHITLIAFQPHKRSLLYTLFTGNITKKNFFSTNIPLVAIPLVG